MATLTPQARVGPYEIVCAIGAGGMGEVYRARDTRLKRDVALKILPESFASDPDRLARFQREAEVLASLNHPNIAAIHGLEESDGTRALVMELVDGEDLSQRIGKGPIPIEEALPLAKQIAEALEAAHEQGVIHRDLKPANIKVTSDGRVKVLDFGLAKLAETPAGTVPTSPVSMSPTITSPALMTGLGVLLGTAAYMSPEQARGRVADRRSDIWAFGCVLYEMVTGRRPFDGHEITDTLAAVLRAEPDWPSVPAEVRRVVRACLEKDPRVRLQSISDYRLLIDAPPTMVRPQPRLRVVLPWSIATVGIIAAIAGAAVAITRSQSPALSAVQFSVPPPATTSFPLLAASPWPALSPDNRRAAFVVNTESGMETIAVRSFDTEETRVLPAPDATGAVNEQPFWSYDGRYIGYFADGKLKKIDASGGPAVSICDVTGGSGGTWNSDGVIVFGTESGGLYKVPAAGGVPTALTKLDTSRNETSHRLPWFLPDNRHFLFAATHNAGPLSIYVGSLDSDAPAEVLQADSKAIFSDGHLLFIRGRTLMAQPFDSTARTTTADPFPVTEGVAYATGVGRAAFTASTAGALAYRLGSTSLRVALRWFDRKGNATGTIGALADYRGFDMSPDGSRIAVHVHDAGGGDLWILDAVRGTTSRFTFDPARHNVDPAWSRDGRTIGFGAVTGPAALLQKPADGGTAEQKLAEVPSFANANANGGSNWSPDGQLLLFTASDPSTHSDIMAQPLGGDRKAFAVVQTPFSEAEPQLSPDGRSLAYQSDETGRPEVYVQRFPATGGKWQVSVNGGQHPRWRADGKELFFLSREGKMMAVAIETADNNITAGLPHVLFDAHPSTRLEFVVNAKGDRFLVATSPPVDGYSEGAPLTVVLNWAARFRP